MRAVFPSFDSRYAEPDRVPCLPDRSALPARRVQRLLRGLPGHHHRAATRYVLDAWFPFRLLGPLEQGRGNNRLCFSQLVPVIWHSELATGARETNI